MVGRAGGADMVIEHVAVWTGRLEELTAFYVRHFGAHAGPPYRSATRPFESRFLAFESGARLELMRLPDLLPAAGPDPRVGLAHLAISVGSRAEVDRLTAELRAAGATVAGEPRVTGDGYYESVVLDPDGNRVELTA
jgi:lactoylglutathione lyase